MDIHFDITFKKMPCSWISVDAMDVSGELQLEVDHDIYRRRLSSAGKPIHQAEKHEVNPQKKTPDSSTQGDPADPNNNNNNNNNGTPYCGSCYGAQTEERPCCDTCQDIRDAYSRKGWVIRDLSQFDQCHDEEYIKSLKAQAGEGCRVWGSLTINKVAGNFHIAPGRSYQQGMMHLHDLSSFSQAGLAMDFDFSHTIQKLAFGKDIGLRGLKLTNPLDGVLVADDGGYRKNNEKNKMFLGGGREGGGERADGGLFQYFLKVVPTEFVDLRGNVEKTNQFAVSENYREANPGGGQQLPGVFFLYDLSPVKVKYKEEKTSFLTFLTGVCAIVGGVYSLSGLLDASIYHGQQALKKKVDLGKAA